MKHQVRRFESDRSDLMSRVNIRRGKSPIIIVAPHGNQEDDQNTDLISDIISKELDAYAVINKGWRRAKEALLSESKANLNSIKHCLLDPCKKEFLQPLVNCKHECILQFGKCNIFYIHGMANKIRHKTNEAVDLVLGFGSGEPPSYTCNLGHKNALVVRLREQGLNVYQGKPGGRFSAWNADNLTQFFRSYYLDHRVQSIQIEIVNLRRYDETISVETALSLSKAFDKLLSSQTVYHKNLEVKEY